MILCGGVKAYEGPYSNFCAPSMDMRGFSFSFPTTKADVFSYRECWEHISVITVSRRSFQSPCATGSDLFDRLSLRDALKNRFFVLSSLLFVPQPIRHPNMASPFRLAFVRKFQVFSYNQWSIALGLSLVLVRGFIYYICRRDGSPTMDKSDLKPTMSPMSFGSTRIRPPISIRELCSLHSILKLPSGAILLLI